MLCVGKPGGLDGQSGRAAGRRVRSRRSADDRGRRRRTDCARGIVRAPPRERGWRYRPASGSAWPRWWRPRCSRGLKGSLSDPGRPVDPVGRGAPATLATAVVDGLRARPAPAPSRSWSAADRVPEPDRPPRCSWAQPAWPRCSGRSTPGSRTCCRRCGGGGGGAPDRRPRRPEARRMMRASAHRRGRRPPPEVGSRARRAGAGAPGYGLTVMPTYTLMTMLQARSAAPRARGLGLGRGCRAPTTRRRATARPRRPA